MPKTNSESDGKIKIFVSTKETQGQRDNDFCFVPENEPVRYGVVCDRDEGNPDGFCGCARSLKGVECAKATTTFKVKSVAITREQYINGYVQRDPYYQEFGDSIIEELTQNAVELLDIAAKYSEGAVLELRAGVFDVRKGSKIEV